LERKAYRTFLIILKSIKLAIHKRHSITETDLLKFNKIVAELIQQVESYEKFVNIIINDNQNEILKQPLLQDLLSYTNMLRTKLNELTSSD